LSRGSTGFANTLMIKTMASPVATTESANHIRRTRRQRRPCGSWKTGDSEADKFAILVRYLISHRPISKSSDEVELAQKIAKASKEKSRPRLCAVDGFGELLGLASETY
jgi:hypothetical protein